MNEQEAHPVTEVADALPRHLPVDLTRTDHLALLASPLGVRIYSIESWRLMPALSAATRDGYVARSTLFERFVSARTGVDIGTVHLLCHEVLVAEVGEFAIWLRAEVDADHPLLRMNADLATDPRGWRKGPEGCCPRNHIIALRWWAHFHGIESPVTEQIRDDSKVPHKPVVKARAMTDDEICAAATALYEEQLWRGIRDPTVREILHARELASFNVQLATAHRPGEREMLLERYAMELDPDDLRVRFPRTKMNNHGRVVSLRARADILCPVWALRRLRHLIVGAGFDSMGFMLPTVVQRPKNPLVATNPTTDARRWHDLMSHIGVLDNPEVKGGFVKATPHSVRVTMATRAVAADWEPIDVMHVGAWQSVETAQGYNRTVVSDELAAQAAGFEAAS